MNVRHWRKVRNKEYGFCSKHPEILGVLGKGILDQNDGCMGWEGKNGKPSRKKLIKDPIIIPIQKPNKEEPNLVWDKKFKCFLCREEKLTGQNATPLVLNPYLEAVCVICYEHWIVGKEICEEVEKEIKKPKIT